ncbi:hypothetical protein GCM10010243_39060 [Streptomyces matensis]|nr:hypothetical protein GCM10010243_39060 [Streptomyces matensis]
MPLQDVGPVDGRGHHVDEDLPLTDHRIVHLPPHQRLGPTGFGNRDRIHKRDATPPPPRPQETQGTAPPRKHRGLHPPRGAGNCAKGGPGAKPPKTRTRRRGEEAPKGRGELRKPEGQGRQLLKTPPTPAQAPKMRVRDR